MPYPGQTQRDLAKTLSFKPDPNGPTYWGHLVTITSDDESNFINSNFVTGQSNAYWIGGYQKNSTSEPDGGWR
jgi:hypothetical protein